jgi:ferritin-like metal-binding protein YciE
MATNPRRTGKKPARGTAARSTPGAKKEGGATKRSGNGRSARPMLENLEDGFLAELGDMLFAAQEVEKILPELARAAESRRLREALEWHAEQSEEQSARLENVFRVFGRKAHPETCEGMQGILTECREILKKTSPGPLRDAMLIGAAQKAGHYEIAAYGTLCSWADQLGEDEALRLLEDTLREKKGADRVLTRIGESFTNPQAERGEERFSRGDRERGQGRFDEPERMRSGGEMRGGERSRGRFGRDHE